MSAATFLARLARRRQWHDALWIASGALVGSALVWEVVGRGAAAVVAAVAIVAAGMVVAWRRRVAWRPEAVAGFAPGSQRRLGILVDHLVPGSKEERLARSVRHPAVLVTGHPFVDVWEGVRPDRVGITAWPVVPMGEPWKQGVCRALGVDPAGFWPSLRNRVRSFADLRPELVGAVEQLIDFVSAG